MTVQIGANIVVGRKKKVVNIEVNIGVEVEELE